MSTERTAVFDHSGTSFDGFLKEGCMLNEVEVVAIKRVILWQSLETMDGDRTDAGR